jgi:hypothetical protein
LLASFASDTLGGSGHTRDEADHEST